MTATRVHANNFSTTLSVAITSTSTTSCTVTSSTGLPALSGGNFFYLTLESGATREIVKVTAFSGTAISTMVRAQEGTTAATFAIGTTVSLRATANSLDRKTDAPASSTTNGLAQFSDTTGLVLTSSTIVPTTNIGTFLTTPSNANFVSALGSVLTVPSGGTGLATMTTAYAPVCAGTTATGNLQVAATGQSNSGWVLTSTGSSSLPTWQAQAGGGNVTGPGSSTNGAIALFNGTGGTTLSSSTIVPAAGVGTFLTTPSSANLATAVTDETGSGALVFANTPTLVTPLLGTPTSGALTNCTSIPVNQATGTLPIANGGTGVTSVTVAPAATTFAGWDANKNLSANNTLEGYSTTTTAAGTTTLVVGSSKFQYFTGSTTQTVLLPVTSTLVLGQVFTIVNNSTGVVTVQSSGANTVQAMAAATKLTVTCILTSGTTAASWDFTYSSNASGITGSGLAVRQTSPTLITPLLGTPASGVLTNCTGLPVAGGGTGLASTTAYGVLCGGTTTTGALQSVASLGITGSRLTSNGAAALPTMKGGLTAFRMYLNTLTSIASSTLTIIPYDTTQFDTGGICNTTTSKITPTIAGKYFMSAQVFFDTATFGTTLCEFQILKNGVIATGSFGNSPASGYCVFTISDLIDMNGTTDFIQLAIYQSSGSSKNLLNGYYTNFVSGILMETA